MTTKSTPQETAATKKPKRAGSSLKRGSPRLHGAGDEATACGQAQGVVAMAKRTGRKAAAGFYTTKAWRCEPSGGDCALLAFVEASDKWETVALVKKTSGASTAALADYLAGMVNDAHETGDLLQIALQALESLVDEGLNFSTEQDADIVIRRLKSRNATMGRRAP